MADESKNDVGSEEEDVLTCKPIKSLELLEHWNEDKLQTFRESIYSVSCIPLARRTDQDSNTPRTLVCHDMKGGYLEDRFVQGTSARNCYRFYNWLHIDTFVYFSHHLVTIPPTGWIDAAHRHGVQVLGTFITEWDMGKSVCNDILQTKERSHAIADILVRIAAYFRFDGWLINIENEIQEEKIPVLCDFVSYLTDRSHVQIPGSKVIWYDSVLDTGKLDWQNEVNDKNSLFFDASDGIFLNYCWKDEHLQRSANTGREKNRLCDVYVGVDVFGRNCYGGGGYNTNKALEMIANHGLSTALFAPGWVYETRGEDDFIQNDKRFWSLLHGYLPCHSHCELPLATSFCQGCGNKFYLNGEVVSEEPWYNLSLQELQPLISTDNRSDSDDICYTTEDAFMGGGCLKLHTHLQQNEPVTYKLFSLDLDASEKLFISFTFKLMDPEVEVYLIMKIKKESEVETSLVLGEEKSFKDESSHVLNIESLKGKTFLPKMNSTLSQENTWTTRYFALPEEVTPCHLCSLYVGLHQTESSAESIQTTVLLGQIQLLRNQDCDMLAPDVQVQMISDKVPKSKLSPKEPYRDIKWLCTNNESVMYYNIFTASRDKQFLVGHSVNSMFRIGNSSLEDSEIIVQPVLQTGTVIPLAACKRGVL
ncbi:hypothetical protein ScPMuIL_004481 [Solemya velum]